MAKRFMLLIVFITCVMILLSANMFNNMQVGSALLLGGFLLVNNLSKNRLLGLFAKMKTGWKIFFIICLNIASFFIFVFPEMFVHEKTKNYNLDNFGKTYNGDTGSLVDPNVLILVLISYIVIMGMINISIIRKYSSFTSDTNNFFNLKVSKAVLNYFLGISAILLAFVVILYKSIVFSDPTDSIKFLWVGLAIYILPLGFAIQYLDAKYN